MAPILLQGRRIEWTKGRLVGFTRGTTGLDSTISRTSVLVFIAARRTLPASRHMNIINGCFMARRSDAVTDRFVPWWRANVLPNFTVTTLTKEIHRVPSFTTVDLFHRGKIGHARVANEIALSPRPVASSRTFRANAKNFREIYHRTLPRKFGRCVHGLHYTRIVSSDSPK